MFQLKDIPQEDLDYFLELHQNIYGFKPYGPIFDSYEDFELQLGDLVMADFNMRFRSMVMEIVA